MNTISTKTKIIKIENKSKIKLLFDQRFLSEIFYAEHNPFLKSTRYQILFSTRVNNNVGFGDIYDDQNFIHITIQWGSKGYKYITLKRIGNLLKKEYPELLI